MAHPKHAQVRQCYHARCGYCGVSEADTGGELTVDHYQPRTAGGGDDEDNLVYACMKCNQYKGAFVPDANDGSAVSLQTSVLLDTEDSEPEPVESLCKTVW